MFVVSCIRRFVLSGTANIQLQLHVVCPRNAVWSGGSSGSGSHTAGKHNRAKFVVETTGLNARGRACALDVYGASNLRRSLRPKTTLA